MRAAALVCALLVAACSPGVETTQIATPEEPVVKAPAEVVLANQAFARVKASKKREDLEFTDVKFGRYGPAICGTVWGRPIADEPHGFRELFIYTPGDDGLANAPPETFPREAWLRYCRDSWVPGTGGE